MNNNVNNNVNHTHDVLTIYPGTARGSVRLPGSKSAAHRALVCAALTPGMTTLCNLPDGDDVAATIDGLRVLGARIIRTGSRAVVTGVTPQDSPAARRVIDCRESGTTLRFLLPVALLFGGTTIFRGSARLLSRPMTTYRDLCRAHGITWYGNGERITVVGSLTGGEYRVSGDVSSQYLSGLLLALPHAMEDSTILVTSALQSAPYVGMTERVMADFGYTFSKRYGHFYTVPGEQVGKSLRRYELPADESSAAYFGALNALGGHVTIDSRGTDTAQADGVWRWLFPQFATGAPTVSVADCPDLAPMLMALGAAQNGVILRDTKRLQYKESDRGAAMAQELRKCGVMVTIAPDGDMITVSGGAKVPLEALDCHNDHRVAMSLGVLLTRLGGKLSGAECVAKSYPEYWDALRTLGIDVK